MSDDEQIGEPIMEQMQEFMRKNLPSKLVTNYIIIAEVADEETQMLHLSISDTMTPWLAYGMLHSASTMLSEGEVHFPTVNEETDETE